MFALKSFICQFFHLYQLSTSYPFYSFIADIRSIQWIPLTLLLLRPISTATQRYLGWEKEYYEIIFLCRASLCSQWPLPVFPARGHPLPPVKKTRRLVCAIVGLQEIIDSREDQTSAHVWVLGLLLGQKESIWYHRQHF